MEISSDSWNAEYLTGLYAPVAEEIVASNLPVTGTLPSRLEGIYVQNMANPAFPPGAGHSWFDGDGMIHSVEFRDGTATYRNRYIETRGLSEDRAAGHATYVGSMALAGAGKRHKNTANTDLVWHAGRLLALWWEGDLPHEISLPDLTTVGTFDYGGTLTTGMTSHAKLDPNSGELHFIAWGVKRPFLTIGVAGEDGRIKRSVPVDLAGPRVQHDMALSDKFICVFDFPLGMDFGRDQPALGFKMVDQPSRIGLLPRDPLDGIVRWFDVEPCYMWHVMCAYDDGDEFVLLGVRTRDATNVDAAGKLRNDRPLVDGEHRFDSYLYEWRLNIATGAVRERNVDTVLAEFPRVNDAFVSSGAKYGYLALVDESAPTLRARGLAKYDLATYERQDLEFPDGCFGYEPCFAAAKDSVGEDDGYIVNFVTNALDGTSELWVTKAGDFAAGPVARVQLPRRVPPGFHGRWVPRSVYGKVKA